MYGMAAKQDEPREQLLVVFSACAVGLLASLAPPLQPGAGCQCVHAAIKCEGFRWWRNKMSRMSSCLCPECLRCWSRDVGVTGITPTARRGFPIRPRNDAVRGAWMAAKPNEPHEQLLVLVSTSPLSPLSPGSACT